MYKKINKEAPQQQAPQQQAPQQQAPQQQANNNNHLYHAQHKAQFNIESSSNMSLNDMKGLSHNNFIQNTNNMREDYQKQHLDKNKNLQINLGFRG